MMLCNDSKLFIMSVYLKKVKTINVTAATVVTKENVSCLRYCLQALDMGTGKCN